MRCDSSLKLSACVNLLLSFHYESEGVPYHVDQSLALPARLRRRGGSEQEQQELQLARLEVGGARLAGRGTARAQYGDVMWKRVRPRGRGWPAVGRKPPSQPACPARQEVARPRRPAETAHTTNATPRQKPAREDCGSCSASQRSPGTAWQAAPASWTRTCQGLARQLQPSAPGTPSHS